LCIEKVTVWCDKCKVASVPKHHVVKEYRGNEGKVPHILDLGTGQILFSLIFLPFYPQRKNLQFPLNSWLDPRTECDEKEKNPCSKSSLIACSWSLD
jgi:hypothetical protein